MLPVTGEHPTIRPAGWSDRAAILGLVVAMGGHDGLAARSEAHAAAFSDALQRPQTRCLVAESAGAVVGYAELSAQSSTLHGCAEATLTALAVDPDARGEGVGRALLAALDREAALLGCAELAVESSSWRFGAHAFYRAAGFAAAGPAERFRRPVAALDPADGGADRGAEAGLEQRFLQAAAAASSAVAGTLAAAPQPGFDPADKSLDGEAERAALGCLSGLGLPILSEEAGLVGTHPEPDGAWIALDPLDASRNRLEGYPPWAMSVGLVRGDAPLAGYVADLSSGRRWWSARGRGATVDGQPARARASGLLVLPSLAPDALPGPLAVDGFQRVRIGGSTAIDLCRVADGSAGAFVDVHRATARTHDITAALAILAEAGASVLDPTGEPVRPVCDRDRRYQLVASPTAERARELLAATGACRPNSLPPAEPTVRCPPGR